MLPAGRAGAWDRLSTARPGRLAGPRDGARRRPAALPASGVGRLGLHGDSPLTTFTSVILSFILGAPRGSRKDVGGREAANGTYEQERTGLDRVDFTHWGGPVHQDTRLSIEHAESPNLFFEQPPRTPGSNTAANWPFT